MNSRALRLVKLLGATAFCYNNIRYEVVKVQDIIVMDCGTGTENYEIISIELC
jgi:hypothetical protein